MRQEPKRTKRARRSELNAAPLIARLRQRSQAARDRALHVLSTMRRNPRLSFTHAAKLEGVKSGTAKKYLKDALEKHKGRFRVKKRDRISATLYVPNANGNSVPVHTRSSREREQVSQYLRDLGRYLRGNRDALAAWHGKKIGGVELVTAGRVIQTIEPALSDFSVYRSLGGDGV